MDHFLTHDNVLRSGRQRSPCRRECGTLTMKCNNERVFKFNKKWKDGLLWLSAEDGNMFCSYCKEFDKTSRNNLSQAVNHCA